MFEKNQVVVPVNNGKIKLVKWVKESPKEVYLKEIEKRKEMSDKTQNTKKEIEEGTDDVKKHQDQIEFETESVRSVCGPPLSPNEAVIDFQLEGDEEPSVPSSDSTVTEVTGETSEASEAPESVSKQISSKGSKGFIKASDDCPEGAERLSDEQKAKLVSSTYGRCEICGAPLKKDGTHRKPRNDVGKKRGSYKKD